MEEADAEDEEGNISKELYILQVAPLESHAGYRLEAEDPSVFSDSREDDPDSWVCSGLVSLKERLLYTLNKLFVKQVKSFLLLLDLDPFILLSSSHNIKYIKFTSP